jgi:hypothetical protein
VKEPKPARKRKRNLKPHAKMKTFTKLTLTTAVALTLGATLLAGPVGPYGPLYGAVRNLLPAREIPAATVTRPLDCKAMLVNRNPKVGGPTYVTCTKAIKETLACRMACR